MAVYDYSTLVTAIDAIVYDNTDKAVKAELLNQLLKDVLDSQTLLDYDTARSYEEGAICFYDDGGGYDLYRCTASTTGAFDSNDWEIIGEYAPPLSTAKLIKSGQTTSYNTADDGDIEPGRGVDFFTLAENNPFGNTNRFTDELGGQTYTNDIVIDWSTYDGSTVLGYYRVIAGNSTWANAMDAAAALSIGSFTSGWRAANIREILNILYYGVSSTSFTNYSPLDGGTLGSTNSLWSSTVDALTTANAFYIITSAGAVSSLDRTVAAAKYVGVREFTVTGTTLS